MALACCLLSCEQSKRGTLDVETDVPFLTGASATPDSIHIDDLIPVDGRYAITSTVRVRMSNTGDVPQLSASVIRSTTSQEVGRITLRDDGTGPDLIARDSIYSGTIGFSITRPLAGNYRIRFIAEKANGTMSNILEKLLRLTRRNAAPVLSNLNAPASAEVPNRPQDTVNVLFSITASDSDGLADIRQVRLKPTLFNLVDDGGLGPPLGFVDPNNVTVYRRSGDAAAGDGIFSITIPLLYSSSVDSVRTDTYGFQAVDSFGDTSATILHQITLRRRQ
jgi:hypothetical protein